MCTLLVVLSTSLVLAACIVLGHLTARAMFLLIPVAVISFALSLIIGGFLSEPLVSLAAKLEAYRAGQCPIFRSEGYLDEVDTINSILAALVKKTNNQRADLMRKEKRQAEFVSDAAHELRTPLTAIRGTAEMLLDPDLPPAMRERFQNTIITESTRLSDLVNDLLSLTRLENDNVHVDLARVNLRTIANEVVNTLQPILHDRKANVKITGEAPDILGNANKLKQALTNLIENASRFIEPHGHIDIELCGLKGNSVIQVKDDGTGFGDIDPKLLFARFYRTDASRARTTGGTGLGLSIVKTIVEQHDGTVEAVNRADGGACFIIAIPSITDAS